MPDVVSHAIDATLLGGFEVRVDGQLIANAQWKLRHPRQLFQMLLLEPNGLPREQVLSVLWPDTDPTAAANRLHHTLHLVRGIFVAAGLSKSEPVALLQADTVRLNPVHAIDVDVRTFSQCVARARGGAGASGAEVALQQALALYRGELAQGCPVDEWLSGRRESLRVEFAWMLERLAELKRKASDDEAAIGLYQQLVDIDPGNELAHRSLMELYATTDHPERAIHQYSVCKRLLRHELDVDPSPATQAVLQRILSTPPAAPLRGAAPSSMPAPRWRYQPMPYAVPLLGRDADVQALHDKLLDPAVRLLTVTGSAGLGKSRVAHAAVERVQERFRNGAIVVSCTGLTDERQVANAVARALGLTLAADTSVRAQLAGRLRPCQLLLLLDRFEHVLAAAPQLAALLQSAPELKVLVTSQVALRLDVEQVVTLPSLLQRDEDAAVDMFCRVAANAGAPVEGDAARAQAAAICRRLDGNPLAIELAAGQTPMLALPQILRSLEQPLAVLTNPALDVEPPQRSLRDAIAWTCSVLDSETQAFLYALSLFGGHCGSDEPEQAFSALWPADTSRRCTQALLDMHVMRRRATPEQRTPAGLEMPDAIAQFAAERLLESPQRDALQSAHAAHAATQVRECFRRMRDESRHDIVTYVLYHRPSWHRAMLWLAQQGAATEHLVTAYQYGVLALMAAATHNAMEVLQAAATRADLTTSEERRMAAWCSYRLARAGSLQADSGLATRNLRAARRMARAEADDYLHDRCLLQLAVVRIDQRRYRAARLHLTALIDKHQAEQRQRDLVREHCLMASLRGAVGEIMLGLEDARTALRHARELASEHHIAHALATLCEASLRAGDMELAHSLMAEFYTLPEHAVTPLRRQHFRLLECLVDFESADFDSAQAKTQRLLESLQTLPMARTHLVARALADMVVTEQGHSIAALKLDDEFTALPAHYDGLAMRVLSYRIRRATERGSMRRAWSALQQAVQSLLRNGHPLWWTWTLEACATAAAFKGDAGTCKAALNLSRLSLRRAGCVPTPRQQRNWQQAEAILATNSPWIERRSLLPLNWPKTDRLLAEKLLAAMERTLLEPQHAVASA